jgi:phosphotransferase system HPr (HPr) family protein
MDQTRSIRTVAVANREGLHLRAANLLVQLAQSFQSRIELLKDEQRIDAKSNPLQLMALGAAEGDQVQIEAAGPDAEEALDALAGLFAAGFGEEADNEGLVGNQRSDESTAEGEPPAG